MKELSARSHISPFQVMEVMQAAHERSLAGKNVVHMEVGQPATGAPQAVLNFVQQKMSEDKMGYTVSFGIDPLRQGLSSYYQTQHDCQIDPRRIAVTTGSSAGFMLVFLAAFNPGDRVALARPGYPAYRNILKALGCEVVEIEVSAEDRYQLTPEKISIFQNETGKIDGVIVASPANPTGLMMSLAEMQDLYDYCQSEQITLISDEIYHGITFEQPAHSMAEIGDQAYILNSFSKYYAMTGWRIGWLVLPEQAISAIDRLSQNMFISAPTISQWGAVAALSCRTELDKRVAGYQQNRDLLCQGLSDLGLTGYIKPQGAFYLYLNISQLQKDSRELGAILLDQTGVALTPGWDFDPVAGGDFIRFSFAGSLEDVRETVMSISKTW